MNRLDLNTLSEDVRKTIQSLLITTNVTELELDGQVLVRVLPYPKTQPDTKDVIWTEEKNARRCDLIDKALDSQITPDERIELETLQDEVRRYVNRVAPLPLKETQKLFDELLAKAALVEQNNKK